MVYYRKNLPLKSEITKGRGCIFFVIYDLCLENHPDFKTWVYELDGLCYPVKAGEELKSIDSFPDHIKNILEKTRFISRKQLVIISVGGGSVGDFAGFIASTLKRGVSLIHLPSTWLAAMDSSHGGKTALNVGTYKNQVGSFYTAEKIVICQSLLRTLPTSQILSVRGELCKMAMIGGGEFYQQFKATTDWNFDNLWNLLPQAVHLKYQIVEQDPKEEKGLREQLNLGHTLGHVLEATHKLSHGEAVAQGLWFSLYWSQSHGEVERSRHRAVESRSQTTGSKNRTTENENKATENRNKAVESRSQTTGSKNRTTENGNKAAESRSQTTVELHRVLLNSIGPKKDCKLAEGPLRDHLLQDKKQLSHCRINFVFLKAPGNVEVRPVTIDSLVNEATRQGWVDRV